MIEGYFGEVLSQAGTEFWSNNPSGAEMRLALENGAVGVASNPVYIAALLKSEPEYVRAVMDGIVGDVKVPSDDETAAMEVIRTIAIRPLQMFHPLYVRSAGRYGCVAVQGNPRRNDDLAAVLTEAERHRQLGENIIIKLPATPVGVQAMEELTARGWPTIGTMSFSVAQYVAMAEAHARGLRRTNLKPRCLITMLPGLFDEYLVEYATSKGTTISQDVLQYAGVSTARAAYAVYRDRGYAAQVLSGGARSILHWSEVVGPGMGITLGGTLAESILRNRPPIADRITAAAPAEALTELADKFPDFRRACDPDGLSPSEFSAFGPVVRFQNSFLTGFDLIIEQLAAAKKRAAIGHASQMEHTP